MNNEDYWIKRAEEREQEWIKKSKDTIEKELAEYYRRALSRITDDIAVLYGRYAKDNNLTYAEASKLLTGKEFKQWRMSLEEYLDAIDKTADNKLLLELNTLAMRKRISRLDKLYGDTLKNLYRLGTDSENGMTKFLSGAYKDNYYKNLFDIGKTIGIRSSVSEVDDKKIRKVLNNSWSGKNYSQRIWKNTDKLAKLIKNEITDGFHRGVSINKMAKLVQQRMNVGKYEATRLVRTEMNYVQNQAALDSIKDADMKYYIFLATLDKKTSTLCRAHDRKVYPVDGATPGTNMPPLHPHCRSTIAGNLTDFDTGKGKRTAKDDKGKRIIIPAKMNYDDYYKVYIKKSMSYEDWEKANNINYMSNSFRPTFGKISDVKVTGLKDNISIKKVENSEFNLWTDLSETKRSMPIKICEKVLKQIKPTLPKILDIPQIVLVDFEKYNFNKMAIGGHDPNTGIIYINTKYRSEKAILTYLSKNKGFFASTDITSPYLHELGHRYYQVVIEKIAENKEISYNRAKELIEEPINKYILNISKIGYESIDMYISSYAYTKYIHNNREELFAETFTLWNNIDENNLLANYIKKVLNDNEISKS